MTKKKTTTVYKCSQCGYTQPRWLGRCPECGSWNTLEECLTTSNPLTPGAAASEQVITKAKPVALEKVISEESKRLMTGIQEFDRVLGGGCVKRSAILIGGEPGIGKSTLLLQTCATLSEMMQSKINRPILYVSGEESATQIKGRADRLNLSVSGIEILCTMRIEDVLDALNTLIPFYIVIDSIQTVYSEEAGVVPGTVNQLKYCANELISWVKEHDSILIMTAHITKEGAIAGPKSLEHMVDTVISFERNNDEVRFLRTSKNRFGSVDELGIFEMTEKGLSGVVDPSTMFITRRKGPLPAGTACTVVFEGSRGFLVELQALTVPAKASLSRVYSEKIESARIARVAAVLEKRTGLHFSDQDLYINVAGGIRLSESVIDAALAAALYSARTDIPLPENTVILGELSLAGEIRPITRQKLRTKTARDLGFSTILAPEKESEAIQITGIKQLITVLFQKK